jgi:hypothetical protein
MIPSAPLTQGNAPQAKRTRPKLVTTYLVLSLVVTAISILIFLIVGTPLGGLNLEASETIPFILMVVISLGCLVATIMLFFWKKWAAIAFYILLGMALLWYGYAFLIQEGLSTINIAGFLVLGVFPIFLFRWVSSKIWQQLD